MKLIKKNELPLKIGKTNFWMPKKIVGLCEYTAGIEEIDEVLGNQNFFKIKPLVNFTKHYDGIEISIMHNFKLYYVGINSKNIKSISFQKGGIIEIGGRSPIGRAIAGGLILGPIGAIIGSVSGMKDKVTRDSDNIMIIAQVENNDQATLFSVKRQETKKVFKFFKDNFDNCFRISE